MKAHIAQWIGRRKKQEDYYVVRSYSNGVLAVVCDGMGGHSYGALSAHRAAEEFVVAFEERPDGSVAERLRWALDDANEAVAAVGERTGAFGGTTLLAAFVGAGVLWWASVGDSPLFLWRNNRLVRLNADHSMRAIYRDFVQSGAMTHAEAMSRGHELRSALTGDALPMVDAPPTPYPLLPGDRIILATDGTDDLLQQPSLSPETRLLLNDRSAPLASLLVGACRRLEKEWADNTTVVTVDIE